MFDELLNNISLGSVSKLLFLLTLIIISIDVVFALINIIIDYYSENSAIIFNNIFTLKNSEKCSRLKYQYHDDPNDKNNVRQFINDGKSILNVYCQSVSLIFTTISFVTSLVICIRFSIVITVFSLVASLPAFFIRKKNQTAFYELEKDLNLTDRIIDYFKDVCTGKQFYKEIHIFGVKSFFFDKLTDFLQQRAHKRITLRKKKMVREIVLLSFFQWQI